jgi:hypothetical protein
VPKGLSSRAPFVPKKISMDSVLTALIEVPFDEMPASAVVTNPDKLDCALADTIAVMLRAIRMGEPAKARVLGLSALAVFAERHGIAVGELLDRGDFGEAADAEVYHAAHRADEPVLVATELKL